MSDQATSSRGAGRPGGAGSDSAEHDRGASGEILDVRRRIEADRRRQLEESGENSP